MATLIGVPVAAAGGSFLLEERRPEEIFTPEDFSEEHRQIAATAAQFAREVIAPAADAVEAKEPGAMRGLLRNVAELGFLSSDIPEEYGGMGMDKTTSAVIADHLSILASVATAFGAHTGIGTLPLVWYGTEAQKQKYLPKLATAEWIAAYALSESTSGSDAMNIRTRAVLSPDGTHYLLNGEKMWITNCGIADLFTVFAKIQDSPDSEKFSAFLVEKSFPGVTVGAEEHKLGIRGSSTCPLVLNDCKVPAENLLGEIGKGHHIAFNVLNVGRFKLGAACVGGARYALAEMIRYARERKAFGKAIAEFGLVQRKIATSAARLYAAESMTYRTVGMMDVALASLEESQSKESKNIQKKIEEYAVECSVLKVYCSEMMSYVADELVSVMGGYGFVEDYPAERVYRDARINRIFEGTNEINRLIVTGWLMKRAMKGQLPLLPAIKQVMDDVMAPPSFDSRDASEEALARESEVLASVRKITLFAAGVASQRYMTELENQQEIMADLADMIAQVYALESALLRARKMYGKATAAVSASMTGLIAEEALALADAAAKRVLAASAEGDELRTQLAILRRLAKVMPADSVAMSRAVAKQCAAVERYPL